MTHLIDGIIDGRILGNVRIALRNIGFRLIVIVVTHEILDGVVRKKLFEFLIELPGQSFVVHEHQRRLLDTFDKIGHRKGFA